MSPGPSRPTPDPPLTRCRPPRRHSERVVAAAAGAPELSGITFVLLDDPISPSLEDLQTGNEQERRPVFLALQADATTLKQDAIDVAAAVGGLLISAVTTLGFALSTYLLADGGRFLDALEKGDTAPLDAASPIAAGIGAVFVAHELAHFGAAAKNGLQTGVPVPLPSLQLGLFGCITRLRGLAPNRQARQLV